MIISLYGKFKSLSTFDSDDLPDFTVITGKNGSGKTQFLELIYNKYSNSLSGAGVNITPGIVNVYRSGLTIRQLNPSKGIDRKIPELIAYLRREFEGLKFSEKTLIEILIENNISVEEFIEMSFHRFSNAVGSKVNIEDLFKNLRIENPSGGIANNDSSPDMKKEAVNFIIRQNRELFNVISFIVKKKGKNVNEINGDDFYSIELPEKYLDSADLFATNLAVIFIAYARRRNRNALDFFYKKESGDINDSISDLEFLKEYPCPWEKINEVLQERGMNYKFDGFDKMTKPEFNDNELLLRNRFTKDLVQIQDLSSGEKIIIGLVIRLFTISYYDGIRMSFPQLLLLDEEDAYLHPEMTNLLMDVLYKTFVKKLGIKILMTTHSPSTIALAPDDSIYEMKNAPSCSLKKITKDQALSILTGNIPTLSIDYKNHKQVFVESTTDVLYFQRLFEKISQNENVNHKLYFISHQKKGKGNCDWVKKIVDDLRTNGVNKIYGIVDWDNKNNPSDHILVHGHNKYYSIENFLIDGLYLAILFLEMNTTKIRNELNFPETYMEYGIIEESNERLQQIWDWMINEIENEFPALKTKVTNEIRYYNNKKVIVPEWLFKIKGHELVTKLRKVFPALDKFKNEGELQDELSLIMAKCYPLVPVESISILKEIFT
jgi:hypothetical protein